MAGPVSQEVADVFTVPNVSVPVPGEGQTIVYVPPLHLRSAGDKVVGILQMLTEHGLEESTFVRSDGSIKHWSDWSEEDRWKIWRVVGKVRQSLNGGIGDFLKSQVPGFDQSPRHRLAQLSGWHLHHSVGESCLEAVIRPLLDDRHPVSAMSLALHGDYVSVLVRDSKSPSGVTLATVGVGQHSPQPFGKTVIHDDLLADATTRASQLSRILNPDAGLPFRLAFQAVFVPNEVTVAPGGVDVPDESEGDDATERSYTFTGAEAVVDETDLIDVKNGPESCSRAISHILSLPSGHPKVVSMMKIISLVTEEVSAPIIVPGDSSSSSVPVAIISNTGSPPRRPTRSAPPPPVRED
jgi:hypothetical protein